MASESDARSSMYQYWSQYAQQGACKVVLDRNAVNLTELEIPELLGLLPKLDGKYVLELGAGIGTYTGRLAEKCEHIKAVDFMESFIDKNKEVNGHHKNIDFVVADVTKLQIPNGSVDVIFSNWLLMYLTDDELADFMKTALGWLKEDGFFFFRESCYRPFGNMPRGANPTKYREPLFYTAAVNKTMIPASEGIHGYELCMSKNLDIHIELKENYDQVCWLVNKIYRPTAGTGQNEHKTVQEFLDNGPFTQTGISRIEWFFGNNGVISSGGQDTMAEFVKLLDLKPGQKVLDVGAGIGGTAFYMAEKYGVEVLGVDYSYNMISKAWQSAKENRIPKVRFMVADASKYDFPEGTFDVVYSKDVIAYIKNKSELFTRLLNSLKPGGKLQISDYCCSEGEHSERLRKFLQDKNVSIISPTEYAKTLEEAGFVNVKIHDKTYVKMSSLRKELDRAEANKEEFLKKFTEEDYRFCSNMLTNHLLQCTEGSQKLGLFMAEKTQ